MKRYNTHTIQFACRLYREKVPLRQILKATGISSHSVVYFHCDPAKRMKAAEATRRWIKANPERWRGIMKRAALKYQAKQRGKAKLA